MNTCQICAVGVMRPTVARFGVRTWNACGTCGSGALLPLAQELDPALYCAEDYCMYLSEGESRGEALWFESLLRREGIRPTQPVLDFGAGSCRYQEILEARGWQEVHSVEINAALIHTARSRLRNPLRAHTDLDELPDDHFCAIVSNMVLEHLESPVGEIRDRLVRKLASGGLLLATMPNGASINRRLSGRRWIGYSPSEHNWFPTAAGARRMLVEAGLEVTRVANESLLFSPFDCWRPRSIVARFYKQTVMRVAERLRVGDVVLMIGRRP